MLILLCAFTYFFRALAQCPQVPPDGLLPSQAVQDCGSSTDDGVLCPFNCSNAFSHTGVLRCQNTSWEVDSNDPPRCIEPCYGSDLVTGYGQQAELIGYALGFWPSPTDPVTTTTSAVVCDLVGAQSCLQTLVGITDLQEFCSRLPGTMECLKAAECCDTSADTIRSSLSSCADSGRVLDNPCLDDLAERCSAACIPSTLGSEANEATCNQLQRVPFCLRREGCCEASWQQTGLATLAASCRAANFTISDACSDDTGLPYVSNEGAEVKVRCEVPRYANSTVLARDYQCQNSTWNLTTPTAALVCLDPPCPLQPHPDGSYECSLNGQSITLSVDPVSKNFSVPFGASCSLRCTESYRLPVPADELRCSYVESQFEDIIYSVASRVTNTGIPRMVRHISTNGSLVPATPQVCQAMECSLPTLDVPAVLNGNISQATLDTLSPSKGLLYVDCNGASQGSTCSSVCATGYYSDPLRSLHCNEGTFEGQLSCLRQPCTSAPVWNFGATGALSTWPSSCVNALHLDTCEVTCAAGYMRDEEVSPYLCEAGAWKAPTTSPCVESKCIDAPVVSNAVGLQACANQPHGYVCPVSCITNFTRLGTVTCERGSYVASGLICILQSPENQDTVSRPATGLQVLLLSVPEATTVQGRVENSANALLALEPQISPTNLAMKVSEQLPNVSVFDLVSALLLLSTMPPSFALRSAMATLKATEAPEVLASLVSLATSRFEAVDLWSNVSQVLLAEPFLSSSNLAQWFSAAMQPLSPYLVNGASGAALAAKALAIDAGATLDRPLESLHFFKSLQALQRGALSTATETATMQFYLTDGLPQNQLDTLRSNNLASMDLSTATSSADFRLKLSSALQQLNVEGVSTTSTVISAAMDMLLRSATPTALEDATAAAAMMAVWKRRSSCTQLLTCKQRTLMVLLDAGREGAQVVKWRQGFFAPEAAAAAKIVAQQVASDTAEQLALLAGALSVFGVREQDLSQLMPDATTAEIRSAYTLSQVRFPTTFFDQMQSFTVSGLDLGLSLADVVTMDPMEGEFALEWAGDTVAGAILRARLSGASSAALRTAYLAAAQVPTGSRSPSVLATTVSSALTMTVEVQERCIITRAVAKALGLNASFAGKAAALAPLDQARYTQSLAAISLQIPVAKTLAQLIAPYAGAETGDLQKLSLTVAIAMEIFSDFSSVLLVALHLQDTLDPEDAVSRLAPVAINIGASLGDIAKAVVTWMWSKEQQGRSHILLGQLLPLLKQTTSGPIFESTVLDAAVTSSAQWMTAAQAEELVKTSFSEFASDASWLSLLAQRAVDQWKDDPGSDLVSKVTALVTSMPLMDASLVAHLAAVYADFNTTDVAKTVFGIVGQEAPPFAAFFAGLWAQKWPARAMGVLDSVSATAEVVESYEQAEVTACSTGTQCSGGSGCVEQIDLSVGFDCQSYCSTNSSMSWPRECLGFAFGSNCQEANLTSCKHTVTQQDLSSYSTGVCVCTSIKQSVHAAAENAKRLARFTAEIKNLQFFTPLASVTVAPYDVVAQAAAQAINATERSEVVEEVIAVINGQSTLTEQQGAYVAYTVATQQGLNGSEAALAALEVLSEDDPSLTTLADLSIYFPMAGTGASGRRLTIQSSISGYDVVDLEQADAVVISTSRRLPRMSAKKLREAFWRLHQLEDVARQLSRSQIMDQFEGGSSSAISAFRAAKAFSSLSVATADALAAGAQASEMLTYLMASGYSYEQAIVYLSPEVSILAQLQSQGDRLAEQFSFQGQPVVEQSSTGAVDIGSVTPLDKAYIPYIQESIAVALGLDPSQVHVVGLGASIKKSLLTNSLDLVIEGSNATLLTANFSSVYNDFLINLEEVLVDANLQVPTVFRTAQVALQQVQGIPNYQFPIAKWLVTSDWSVCPAVCGEARQYRDVKCSIGNEFACDAAGPKPTTEQVCEAYLDCPFELSCPLDGPGTDIECPLQLALAIGIVVLSILCCCCVIGLFCKYCDFSPRTGQLRLIAKGGQSMTVNFYVVDKSKETTGVEDSGRAQEDKKTIVWDIDVEKAQQLEFQQYKMQKLGDRGKISQKHQEALKRLPGNGSVTRRSTQELLQQHEEEAVVEFERSIKSQAQSEATTPRTPRTPQSVQTIASRGATSQGTVQGDATSGPYRPRARVEYFSISQARWMPGKLESELTPNGYDVTITVNRSSQFRQCVPLSLLRSPILEGELVSVYSPTTREWYHGQVMSKSAPSNTFVGYSVKVLKDGEEEMLQTQNVWRRFPAGTCVEVYDDSLGWLPATVEGDEGEMREELPGKDMEPTWFEVEVVFQTGEKDKVPGYRVQREVMSL